MTQFLQYPQATRPSASDLEVPGSRIIASETTGHRILLPEDGELVLGRYDPDLEDKPDVDLTQEDMAGWGISRRHARIVGWRGQYEIEDLESKQGTWVNDEPVSPRTRQALHTGDAIRLGGCTFFFDRPPTLWRLPLASAQPFLYVTFTGHYFSLPDQNVILIGRSDSSTNFIPDIDLAEEEEAATAVSRRHTKLTRHGEQFMVEDMGSTFKTRLNGENVYAGIKVPLSPGQHLWLGGYTLAFDMVEKPSG